MAIEFFRRCSVVPKWHLRYRIAGRLICPGAQAVEQAGQLGFAAHQLKTSIGQRTRKAVDKIVGVETGQRWVKTLSQFDVVLSSGDTKVVGLGLESGFDSFSGSL
ncbi:hypothetical protein D3C72_679480 [compost metagenome]